MANNRDNGNLEIELRTVLGEYTNFMVEWIKHNKALFIQVFQSDISPYHDIIINLKAEIKKWANLKKGVAKR